MALVYLAALLDRVYTIVRVCLHIVAPPGVASSQISRRTEGKAVNAWCIPRYGFKKVFVQEFLRVFLKSYREPKGMWPKGSR